MADEEDKASGDVAPEQKPVEPESEPIKKIPDVELIVDGFGFMPKSNQDPKSRTSNIFPKKSKNEVTELEGEQDKSPCASSTNIDIVRRYTWKTKNRMIVQV